MLVAELAKSPSLAPLAQPIALIGLPGSGKSTVGRQLARRLGAPFSDCDEVIERQIGTTIREYFEQHGEAAFRSIESEVIARLVASVRGVISTGGGAVLMAPNRELLHGQAKVIYLRSSPEDVFRRLRHDRNRPLLQVKDPLGRLRELFEVRDPLYRETAHFVIETGRPSVATLVNMIVMQLELAGIATTQG